MNGVREAPSSVLCETASGPGVHICGIDIAGLVQNFGIDMWWIFTFLPSTKKKCVSLSLSPRKEVLLNSFPSTQFCSPRYHGNLDTIQRGRERGSVCRWPWLPSKECYKCSSFLRTLQKERPFIILSISVDGQPTIV